MLLPKLGGFWLYRSDLAQALYIFGLLHSTNEDFGKAEIDFKESLALRRHLAMVNPTPYRRDVASSVDILGVVFRETKRFTEAETALAEAVLFIAILLLLTQLVTN